MNTLTVCGLESVLKELGLKTPIPQCPATNLLINPLDISRSYIVDIIQSVVNCDETVANNSVYWPNNIYNGDFTVIRPKLGEKASNKDMAVGIIGRV
jgi:arginyl-tRNA synthetase